MTEAQDLEYCTECGSPTGKAGRGEDSLYCDDCDLGPFCEDCYDKHQSPHTQTQAKFLREFAEALGWECVRTLPGATVRELWLPHHVAEYDVRAQVIEYEDLWGDRVPGFWWLVTPYGQVYLIQRAREAGWDIRTYRPRLTGKGVSHAVEVNCYRHVADITGLYFSRATADTEPWATALAVGKVFGVEMTDES